MLWLWMLTGCLVAVPVAGFLVAAVEARGLRGRPVEVEYFTLARSLAGVCHVWWGRSRAPVVRFPLRFGEGRVLLTRRALSAGLVVEVRGHQERSCGFSARICGPSGGPPGRPAARPARWHAPGLVPVELASGDGDTTGFCSLETTDERLLRWLLRHPETRRSVDALWVESEVQDVEIVLAGRLILLRATGRPEASAGQLLGTTVPVLIVALRRLSDDLHDLACALEDAGEMMNFSFVCRGCGARLGPDPWRCPGCRETVHRGCREMAGGCANARCDRAPDAIAAPTS